MRNRLGSEGDHRVACTGMVPADDADFGALLRTLRLRALLTQEELAERAGLTVNAVGSLERGVRRRPYPHTVRALADALQLDADERARLAATRPDTDPVRTAVAPAAAGDGPDSHGPRRTPEPAVPRPLTPTRPPGRCPPQRFRSSAGRC